MALSSTSTDAEVKAAYDDNADYDINESASQAGQFIVACRILIRRLPKSGKRGQSEFELTPGELRKSIDAAKQWLAANGRTAVIGVDFTEFRQ